MKETSREVYKKKYSKVMDVAYGCLANIYTGNDLEDIQTRSEINFFRENMIKNLHLKNYRIQISEVLAHDQH